MKKKSITMAALLWIGTVGVVSVRGTDIPASLGAAGNYGVLGWGTAMDIDKIGLHNPESGVFGNVGLGPFSRQNFSDGFITGDLYVDLTADNSHTLEKVHNSPGGTNPVTVVNADLSQAVIDAINASEAYAALPPISNLGNITNSLTINANPGLNVYTLESFQYTTGSNTLTLNGTTNDSFVFNIVSGGIWKMTGEDSKIVATGGLAGSHILWNVLGAGEEVRMSGGPSGPTALGTILAPDRDAAIALSQGSVTGALIAGGRISITTGGRVYQDSFVVPETATLEISLSSLTGGTAGSAYDQTISANGGSAPYTFVVSSNALPAGLSLTSGGMLSGTPTAAGTFGFTVTATDASSRTGSRAYTVVIAQSPLTVTADAQSKAYGDNDPALTYQITSGALMNGDSLSGSLTRQSGEGIGSYAIQQGALTAGGNYALTFVPASLTVAQRALTVTAEAKSKAYGDNDPALTYQVTSGNLVNGDSLSGSLIRQAGESIGSHPIQQGTLAAGGNYALTFVPASLTIAQRALTVTAEGKSKAYGDNDPALTYQVTSGNLVNGDSLSGSVARQAGENAGNHAIQQGTLAAGGNYALTFVPASLTIEKRALVAKVDDEERAAGSSNPAFTISYANFINGEDASALDMPPTASTVADANSPVGAYELMLSGGIDNNYSLTLSNGTLTVIPAESSPPWVNINAPGSGEKETDNLTMSGTAGDDGRISRVWMKLNNGSFQSATVTHPTPNTANWTIPITLAVGTNIAQIKVVDLSGNETTMSRSFFLVVRSLFTLVTNGAGGVNSKAMLSGTPTNGALLKIDRPYTVNAVPANNHLFNNWTRVDGGVTNVVGTAAEHTFPMQPNMTLIANFMTNQFAGAAGSYLGLFREPTGVAHHSSGFFKFRVTPQGKFSGLFLAGGVPIGMTGTFRPDGTCTVSNRRGQRGLLTVNMILNLNGGDMVTGTVSHTNGWVADLLGDRVVWKLPDNPATNFAGRYTMIIPGHTNVAEAPGGDGYGLIRLGTRGAIGFSGFTADGPRFKVRPYLPIPAPATVSKQGYWPFYATLYPGYRTNLQTGKLMRTFSGSILGWLCFTNGSLGGILHWNKPASTDNFYDNGFTNEVQILASPYVPPAPGQRALDLTNGIVVLKDGDLTFTLTNNITWDSANLIKVPSPNLNALTLEMVTTKGFIKGEFNHPDLGETTFFRGALLQNQNVVRGFFVSTNQLGSFLLQGN